MIDVLTNVTTDVLIITAVTDGTAVKIVTDAKKKIVLKTMIVRGKDVMKSDAVVLAVRIAQLKEDLAIVQKWTTATRIQKQFTTKKMTILLSVVGKQAKEHFYKSVFCWPFLNRILFAFVFFWIWFLNCKSCIIIKEVWFVWKNQ